MSRSFPCPTPAPKSLQKHEDAPITTHGDGKIATPQQSMAAFARAINDADLDAATACFARDGCLITPDATAIRGREAIRPLLAQLISRRTRIAVEFSSAVAAGDVALVHQRWRIRSGGDGSGDPFVQSSTPTLLLRRLESDWKLAIAALWGMGERALRAGDPSRTRAMA